MPAFVVLCSCITSTPAQIALVCIMPPPPFNHSVVVRSSLAPFDCTKRGDVRTMDAEPSIICNNMGAHGRMKIVSAITIVLCVPCALMGCRPGLVRLYCT